MYEGQCTPLHWLPADEAWRARLKALRPEGEATRGGWEAAIAIGKTRLYFRGTNALDQAVQARFGTQKPPGLTTKPVRLALLGSSTTNHLMPAIRVAALRRGLLRRSTPQENVDLLSLDRAVAKDGLFSWFSIVELIEAPGHVHLYLDQPKKDVLF